MRPAHRIYAGSLDERERRTVERFIALLAGRLGNRLVSAWLYGSRARRAATTGIGC